MRKLTLMLLFALPQILLAQGNVPVNVSVADFDGTALVGEQIWFKEMNTKEVVKGVSNEEGKFSVQLNGPGIYMIMIKSIGDAEDYTKFSIPSLPEGKTYGTYDILVEIEPVKTFTLDNVYFETGKASLKAESNAELQELYELMENKKTVVIEIGGHTDDTGSDEVNLKLSQERADAVKAYLVKKGIDPNRIQTKGYGPSRPIADNSTEEGRAMNRRTEVKIIKE